MRRVSSVSQMGATMDGERKKTDTHTIDQPQTCIGIILSAPILFEMSWRRWGGKVSFDFVDSKKRASRFKSFRPPPTHLRRQFSEEKAAVEDGHSVLKEERRKKSQREATTAGERELRKGKGSSTHVIVIRVDTDVSEHVIREGRSDVSCGDWGEEESGEASNREERTKSNRPRSSCNAKNNRQARVMILRSILLTIFFSSWGVQVAAGSYR